MATKKRTPEQTERRRELDRMRHAEWRRLHPEESRARNRASRLRHPEAGPAYKAANAEAIKEQRKEWHAANRDRNNRRSAFYGATHVEQQRERNAAYRASHTLAPTMRILVHSAKSRAKKMGWAFDGLMSILNTDPVSCVCCSLDFDYSKYPSGVNSKGVRRTINPRRPTLDRVDNRQGYVSENVRVICWRCNALKRDATLEELKMIVAYMEH